MKSLYNATDNAELVARIEKLKPDSVALWGKMNVAQMLYHCQVPMKLAFEELSVKRGLAGILFGRMAKKKLVGKEPFPKNSPTFKEAKITDQKDFETEKANLIKQIKRFTAGPDVITKKPHPFFGPLTPQEWDILQYKHLDHHLKQFRA